MAKSGSVAAVPAPAWRHGRRSGGRGLSLRVILVAALLALVGVGLLVWFIGDASHELRTCSP